MSSTNGIPEFVPWTPDQRNGAPNCAPPPAEEDGVELTTIDPVVTPANKEFCDRVEAIGDMLDSLGQSLRDNGAAINTDDVASMIESIIQTGVGVAVGSSISGRIADRLKDAVPRIDFGSVLDSWQRAVGTFCPGMSGRLLNQLAARYVLQALADFTVAWGASESKSSGQGSSLSLGLGLSAGV